MEYVRGVILQVNPSYYVLGVLIYILSSLTMRIAACKQWRLHGQSLNSVGKYGKYAAGRMKQEKDTIALQ